MYFIYGDWDLDLVNGSFLLGLGPGGGLEAIPMIQRVKVWASFHRTLS